MAGCESASNGSAGQQAYADSTSEPTAIGAVQQIASDDGVRRFTVDAGVIFLDEPTYRCIPLSEIGIESADAIQSIETSCECVQARTLQYRESGSETGEALRLDILSSGPQEITDAPLPTPLAVTVVLILQDGAKTQIIVRFKQSIAVDKSAASYKRSTELVYQSR